MGALATPQRTSQQTEMPDRAPGTEHKANRRMAPTADMACPLDQGGCQMGHVSLWAVSGGKTLRPPDAVRVPPGRNLEPNQQRLVIRDKPLQKPCAKLRWL